MLILKEFFFSSIKIRESKQKMEKSKNFGAMNGFARSGQTLKGRIKTITKMIFSGIFFVVKGTKLKAE